MPTRSSRRRLRSGACLVCGPPSPSPAAASGSGSRPRRDHRTPRLGTGSTGPRIPRFHLERTHAGQASRFGRPRLTSRTTTQASTRPARGRAKARGIRGGRRPGTPRRLVRLTTPEHRTTRDLLELARVIEDRMDLRQHIGKGRACNDSERGTPPPPAAFASARPARSTRSADRAPRGPHLRHWTSASWPSLAFCMRSSKARYWALVDVVITVQARELGLDLGHRLHQPPQLGDLLLVLRRSRRAATPSATLTSFRASWMLWYTGSALAPVAATASGSPRRSASSSRARRRLEFGDLLAQCRDGRVLLRVLRQQVGELLSRLLSTGLRCRRTTPGDHPRSARRRARLPRRPSKHPRATGESAHRVGTARSTAPCAPCCWRPSRSAGA